MIRCSVLDLSGGGPGDRVGLRNVDGGGITSEGWVSEGCLVRRSKEGWTAGCGLAYRSPCPRVQG